MILNLKLVVLLQISSCMVFSGVNAAAYVPKSEAPRISRHVDVAVPKLGTYHGIRLESENLTQPVNAWLGIDYVKQPVGGLRFRKPQPLGECKGKLDKKIIDATQYGLICPQNKVSGGGFDWANWPMGEACLNLNIYRPAGVSMKKKLPVAFYMHAGGFNRGAARMYNGASFVASAQTPVMIVTINYRVGALGFLPSTETAEAGLLSLGLRDQVAALKWVHKNIRHFGGDKNAVTIFGLSAGAHSVGFHMLNYKKGVKPMFQRAIMSSGGPTSRAYPTASWPLYEKQYLEFLTGVGCSPGRRVWDCLRKVDIEIIRLKQVEIYTRYNWQITWPFQPVLGGPLIGAVPTHQWATGSFYKVPVIVGNVHDEGSNYAPKNLSTNAEFRTFFKNLAPLLTEDSLDKIEELYPDPLTNPDSPYVNSPLSAQFQRLQVAYGDYAYICQAEETAVRASRYKAPVWRYTFNQNNTFAAWQGTPHMGDMSFQCDERGTTSRRISRAYNAWLTSFVATGDPNTHALKRIDGETTPYWPRYKEKKDAQISMGPHGKLAVEPHGYRKEQCTFWRSIASQLNH